MPAFFSLAFDYAEKTTGHCHLPISFLICTRPFFNHLAPRIIANEMNPDNFDSQYCPRPCNDPLPLILSWAPTIRYTQALSAGIKNQNPSLPLIMSKIDRLQILVAPAKSFLSSKFSTSSSSSPLAPASGTFFSTVVAPRLQFLHTLNIDGATWLTNDDFHAIGKYCSNSLQHLSMDYMAGLGSAIDILFGSSQYSRLTKNLRVLKAIVAFVKSPINVDRLDGILSNCTELRELVISVNLADCPDENKRKATLMKLENLKELEVLRFFPSADFFDDELLQMMGSTHVHLRKLVLRSSPSITDKGIENLFVAGSCNLLQHLDFGCCKSLTNAATELICSISSSCASIQSLSLDYCPKIDDRGFENIGSLVNLTSLNISGTGITSTTILRLTEKNRKLIDLSFSKTKVCDEGIDAICSRRHSGLLMLKQLNFSGCHEVSENSILGLMNLKDLKRLNFFGCAKLQRREAYETMLKLKDYFEKVTFKDKKSGLVYDDPDPE